MAFTGETSFYRNWMSIAAHVGTQVRPENFALSISNLEGFLVSWTLGLCRFSLFGTFLRV